MKKCTLADTHIINPITTVKQGEAMFRKIWPKNSINWYESAHIMCLNRNGIIIYKGILTIGDYSNLIFDIPRMVWHALNTHSNAVIIAHNHTNGTPHPSQADLDITAKLAYLLSVLDMVLADHLILTHDDCYSFKENKLIMGELFEFPKFGMMTG